MSKQKLVAGMFLLPVFLYTGTVCAAGVSINGEFRTRPEFKNNTDYNKTVKDTQSFIGSRTRITATGNPTEDVLVKVTVQDTRNWGGGGSATGLTGSGQALDLHEGFVEFKNFLSSFFTLKIGRQELVYGDQRLVGSVGWSNQGRAFEAFKASISNTNLNVDLFTAKRLENNSTPGSAANDRDFYGLYAVLKKIIPNATLDLYYMVDREGDTAAPNKPKNVQTAGGRLSGKINRFDYTLEAPWQSGDNGTKVPVTNEDVKIQASALAAKVGFVFPVRDIRIGAEYNSSSGDANSSDNRAKTFNNLYPTNHIHYGYMDEQGWRNMRAWNVNLSAKPIQKLYGYLGWWDFALDDPKDGWYNAGGSASGFRAGNAAFKEDKIGSELDLLLRYAFDPQTTAFELGIGRFFRGKAIKERVTGTDGADADFVYLMMTVKF